MATQLEFLMQLYMINLIQQQHHQQQLFIRQQTIHQQQQEEQTQQNKNNATTEHSPKNCSSSSTSTSMNSSTSYSSYHLAPNTSDLSVLQISHSQANSTNPLHPINFSKSFLQSSTVTSTPTDGRCNNPDNLGNILEYDDAFCSTETSGSLNSGDHSKVSAPISETTNSTQSSSFPSFSPIKIESGLPVSSSMDTFVTPTDNKDSSVIVDENSREMDSKTTVKSENSVASTDASLFNAPHGSTGTDNILQNEESLKYLKKFTSYLECENVICHQQKLREHFHCYDQPCCGRILNKRDEIIRHLKLHKKRKESLTFGFMRFSSTDDCSTSYGSGCSYNWKQTHYHCVEEGCPKVYVSTSDVQMHANFHRKNSEIIQEGFKRFRAVEDCKTESCPFSGKKTSHYHCRRDNCQFTFKNKADMEKHKSYHIRDMRLTQDGFKKILKTKVCPFENCRFSTVCNHIHCVRENCNYVLHSSSQLVSHKRKHDRLDGELAYQHFKKGQKDSSEDDSPNSSVQPEVSTPLSSLTAESSNSHFLSRKRGRPPKKIQPSGEGKKPKVETTIHPPNVDSFPSLPIGFPLPIFNPQATTVPQDPMNIPNLQLTHLMAMFQLQNPLFLQNLYLNGGSVGTGALGLPLQNPIFPTPVSTPTQLQAANEDKQKE